MRKRRNVILGLAITSWLAIACGSGVGALSTIDDGNDRPPDTRESPGVGREAPPTTRDVPPTSQDNPGSQGGGPGAAAATTCPPCDGKLDCSANGKKTSITLKTVNGECSAGDDIVFDCAGKVLQKGTAIGSWKGSGDTYTVTVTVQGQSQTLACTKSTTTTAPTGTTTSVPPVDAGIPDTAIPDTGILDTGILDTGIKG
jgi:hypothetical protein